MEYVTCIHALYKIDIIMYFCAYILCYICIYYSEILRNTDVHTKVKNNNKL